MRQLNVVLILLCLTVLFAGSVSAQTMRPDTTAEDTLSVIATRLPLSTPMMPLPSGVLTNVDAGAANWRMMQLRLLSSDTSLTDPSVYLTPKTLGMYNFMNEYHLRPWQATPQQMIDREKKRANLTPDGRVIKP